MSDTKPNESLPARTGEMAMGQRGIEIRTYEDAYRFAKTVIESGFAPKGMTKNAQVLIALQTGAEAGLTPMQSLSSVVVVNGRASWMGDAAKAIVRRAGLLEPGTDFDTRIEGEGDNMRALAIAHRRGQRLPVSYDFSVADAKRAGLWGKAGPWAQYPKRMLKYRAEGFLLRDHFSDALMGLYTEHEARDLPDAAVTGQFGPDLSGAPVPDPLLEGADVPEPAVVDAEYKDATAALERQADAMDAMLTPDSQKEAPHGQPVTSSAPAEDKTPAPTGASENVDPPVGGETEKAPEQGAVTATEESREAPVLSSAAPTPAADPPKVRRPETWNERGNCVGCGRHQSFVELQRAAKRKAHSTDLADPTNTRRCPYGDEQ